MNKLFQTGKNQRRAHPTFWRPKDSSITRKVIWHGSTAFVICGFGWVLWATAKNERNWKQEEFEKLKKYEELVLEYKQQSKHSSFESSDENSKNQSNGMH